MTLDRLIRDASHFGYAMYNFMGRRLTIAVICDGHATRFKLNGKIISRALAEAMLKAERVHDKTFIWPTTGNLT